MKNLYLATLLLLVQSCAQAPIPDTRSTWEGKPRVVVMTDGEIDDRCSMVHFLLYTNQMQVDAIIQTNSGFQRKGWSSEPWIEAQLAAYEQVLPNLRVHDAAYPSAEELRKVVYVGDDYGIGGNDESVYNSDFRFICVDDYTKLDEYLAEFL